MITTVARKLQVPAATTVVVLNRPARIDLDLPADCLVLSDPATAETADVVIGFAVLASDLDGIAARPSLRRATTVSPGSPTPSRASSAPT